MSHPPQASSQGVKFPAVTRFIDPASLSLTIRGECWEGQGGSLAKAPGWYGERGQGQPAGRDQGPEASALSLLSASLKLGLESDVILF